MGESDLLSDDEVILAEFIDESESSLAATDPLFVDLEKSPSNTETINAIFRPIHSLKANSAFLGLLKLKEIAHAMETMLDALRRKEATVTREIIDLLLAGVDEMRAIVQRIKAKSTEVENVENFLSLVSRIVAFRDPHPGVPPHSVPSGKAKPQEVSPAAHAVTAAAAAGATLRVQSAMFDTLVARAGKAAEIAERLKQMVSQRVAASPGDTRTEMVTSVEQLSIAMSEITESIGRIHKAPLNELFQKVPRIVRTLCSECRKEVTVTLKGGDILVGRQILQGLDAPITHMVRNSVDHGAENPEERLRLGKPRDCRLVLHAYELQGELMVKISDDGAGIDYKVLLAKALKEGVLSPNQKITPQDVTNLIFRPGLSTARKITDISGRGVGMDVVKRSIEQLGGTVEVQSVQGNGTDLIIRLPNP